MRKQDFIDSLTTLVSPECDEKIRAVKVAGIRDLANARLQKFSPHGDGIEEAEIPFFHPLKEGFAVLVELHGQPDVGGVDGIGGSPAIAHVDEGTGLALDRKYESGLGLEGDFSLLIRADAGVAEIGPWAEDVIGAGKAGAVGFPTRWSIK